MGKSLKRYNRPKQKRMLNEIKKKKLLKSSSVADRDNILQQEPTSVTCDWDNCGKRYCSSYNLEVHKKRVHYKKALHKCTKCVKGFYLFEDLKNHFLHTHSKWKLDSSDVDIENGDIFADEKNTISTVPSSEVLSSQRELTADKGLMTSSFECNSCSRSFRSSNALERHKKTRHIDKLLHICTKCNVQFNTLRRLKNHLLRTHTMWEDEDSADANIKNGEISADNKSSINASKAQNPMPIVNENNNHSNDILEHEKNTTGTVSSSDVLSSKPELMAHKGQITLLYYCDSCTSRFNSSDALDRHRKIQHIDKSLCICTKCNEQFDTFGCLKKHFLRTHTSWEEEDSKESSPNEPKAQNPMPFVEKSKSNNHSIDILKHEKKTTSTVPSSDVLSSQRELTAHKGHMSLIYNCNSCSKSFKRSDALERHKKKQHIDKLLHVCTKCNEQFDTFQRLKKHFLRTHTMLEEEDLSDDDVKSPSDECRNMPDITKIKNLKKNITKNFKRMISKRKKNTTRYTTNTRSPVKVDKRKRNAVKPNLGINHSTPLDNTNPVPQNTYVIISVADSRSKSKDAKTTFYIVRTKPNVDASTSNAQDNFLYQPLINNTTSNTTNTVTLAPSAKSAAMNTSNIANIPEVTNITSILAGIIPPVTNRQSKVPYIIPVASRTTTNAEKVMPDDRNTTGIVANAMPDVKKTTSNFEHALPANVSFRLANVTPVLKNSAKTKLDLRSINKKSIDEHEMVTIANNQEKSLLVERSEVKKNRGRCKCSYCVDIIDHKVNGKRVHRCDHCGETVSKMSDLQDHVKLLKGYCEKSFRRCHRLSHHITNLRSSNVCKDCGTGFYRKDNLRTHMRTHKNWKILNSQDDPNTDNIDIIDEVYWEEKETNDKFEIKDDVFSKGDNDKITHDHYPEEVNETTETVCINGDISENEENSATESEEEEDDTNTVGVLEEVCLDLGEDSFDNNTPPDPLSKIKDYNISLLQREIIEPAIILPIPEQIINIKEENIELIPEQIMAIEEEFEESIPANRVKREESIHVVPEQIKINIKDEIIEPILEQVPNIKDEHIESMPEQVMYMKEEVVESIPVKKEKGEESIHVLPEQIINTKEESMEPIYEQIANIEDDNMELIPERKMYTEEKEVIESISAKRTKHVESILRVLLENRILQVRLEKLPF